VAVCVVSGASGLVGSEIVAQLLRTGHEVRAWRNSASSSTSSNIEYTQVRLGRTPIAAVEPLFAGADVFIHCAWDLQVATWDDIERVNVDGSIAWFEGAARRGVRKLIFVSSVSAYTGCRSMYGRSKLLVEAAVTRLGGVNVRPGIVHGDPTAGVYGRLWQSTSASFIPLIDGGHQHMLTVHREDLALAITRILDDYAQWKGRTIVIGHPELVTLRGMLERMLEARGRTAHFVTVPSQPVLFALRCAERAGLRLQFRSDSLLTLMGEEPRVERGVLQELKVPFRSLDDALKSRV
jgi:nucleoside-diphosphate-sugar epimerase